MNTIQMEPITPEEAADLYENNRRGGDRADLWVDYSEDYSVEVATEWDSGRILYRVTWASISSAWVEGTWADVAEAFNDTLEYLTGENS